MFRCKLCCHRPWWYWWSVNFVKWELLKDLLGPKHKSHHQRIRLQFYLSIYTKQSFELECQWIRLSKVMESVVIYCKKIYRLNHQNQQLQFFRLFHQKLFRNSLLKRCRMCMFCDQCRNRGGAHFNCTGKCHFLRIWAISCLQFPMNLF